MSIDEYNQQLSEEFRPIGKFQAAGCKIESLGHVKGLTDWLEEAVKIQWDYHNLPKNRALVKLTSF